MFYNSRGGITYQDTLTMTVRERDFFLERLARQVEEENRQAKRAEQAAAKRGKRRR